jgi:hypothetical protein
MPFRTRTILREAATAVAVLALYVLVLLAPLHQAAGLQRDLNALGYASLDTWSICVPFTLGDTQEPVQVAKCPMAGIGKNDLALATPPSTTLDVPVVAAAVAYPATALSPHRLETRGPGQPRAPPVSV